MATKTRFLLAGAAILALLGSSRGQEASSWRVFRATDGMSESACAAVTVSPNGKVVVTHPDSDSISELDGYTVKSSTWPGVDGGRVRATPGGQLWALAPEGFMERQDNSWIVHPVPEIAAELKNSLAHPFRPVPFYPFKQGRILFLLPERLMEFHLDQQGSSSTTVLRSAGQTRIGPFSGMTPARDGGVWIAGANGLARVTGPIRSLGSENEWRDYLPPDSLGIQNFREPTEDAMGGVTSIAESTENGKRMVVCFDGSHWTALSAEAEKIRFAWRRSDKGFGAATIDGLFRWQNGRMEEDDAISARQYLDAAVAPDGAVWLATSEGLFRQALPAWRMPAQVRKVNTYVYCLAEDSMRRLWFVSAGRLHVLQNDSHQEFPLPEAAQRPRHCSLFPLRNRALLLELDNLLFQFQPDTGLFNPLQQPGESREYRVLGRLRDGGICVQDADPDALKHGNKIEVCDGAGFQPFPFPAPDPGLGARLTTLYVAQNGDLWLGGERGVARCHNQKWQTFLSADAPGPETASGFSELGDGAIWCAAQDRIWEFNGQQWVVVQSGFDGINALMRARNGDMWVASNSGVFRFFSGTWVENGPEEGLPSGSVNRVYEDQDDRVWAATARGLALYFPKADHDAPRTYIEKTSAEEIKIPEGGSLSLTFHAVDRWKFTPSSRLLYSYRLDQGDPSPFKEESTVSFHGLSSGKHYFQVRAMDRSGNIDRAPAKIEFTVALPWYREPRLVLILFVGLAVALFFAILAFNRHLRLLASYAAVEKKVAERTRELELANRELLHNEKMTALGTLAAGVAHDFNNILSIIKGSVQIIEDNIDNPVKIRTRVDRVKTVVEQGAGIVQAMLGFSRGSDQQPARCDLNEVVNDTIRLLGDRFLREVEVRFEPAPNLPTAPAPKDFVQQILLNFIFNAAESMTQSRLILLTTRRLEALPVELALAPARAPAYVTVSVRDSGCGIAPETLPRIFEPFFTTKSLSARRGTGLGLSMVYELARKMGAGLAVETIVDLGSTFTLVLPVTDGTASNPVAPSQNEHSHAAHH